MAKQIALIVAADEPALFFSSVRAAEQYLEAVDVEDGVYSAAYGPDGAPYSVGTESGHVVVRPVDGRAPRPDALKSLLLSFLSAIGMSAGQDESLQTLLDRCAPYLDA